MQFETYPFEKLAKLLEGVEPSIEYEPIALTIGEPQFPTPSFITEELCKKANLLKKYPKTSGEPELKEAMRGFVKRRFHIELDDSQIIPTFGTRELLFNFPQFLLSGKSEPKMAFTNPFYQIYEGAAIASKSKVVYLNLLKERNFLPKIDECELSECDLVILN
ncbi:MAG: aminotransferase class I/II-fold pyridoxal phosphate-dependent enzyme, partial [Hydrogenimonas sp.]|nr:aminotransferase class I/II-fold pyridoxal phosphate-dependent enzyme [Hydrogenimonas sp.]